MIVDTCGGGTSADTWRQPGNVFERAFNATITEPLYVLQRTSSNLWGEWMGVLHGDEVEYVFGHPMNMSLMYSNKERDLSVRMILYFSKFAYSG